MVIGTFVFFNLYPLVLLPVVKHLIASSWVCAVLSAEQGEGMSIRVYVIL
jgi:hypothetical protein